MNKNTITLKNNTLKINFGNIKPRKYGVSVKYFDGKNKVSSKRIDYEVEIAVTSNQGSYLLDIFKRNIWFDQHEPDFINEIIANELSQSLYPVQVRVDKNDMTLIEHTNYKQILSRWYRNKEKATQKYATPIAQSFYNNFEKNLESINIFEKSMHYDCFWNLFFHPKYIDYGVQHSVNTNLYLAVIPYEYPIQFTGKQTINTEITDHHSIEVHFKSDEMEAHPYFIAKARKNNLSENAILMRLNVYFDLDVYYLFSVHIRAYFEVYSKDSKGKEAVIKRVAFTQYQQETENNKTTPLEKRSPFEVYEEDDKEVYKTYEGKNYTYNEWVKFEEEQYNIYKEKKTKKGFWSFLD